MRRRWLAVAGLLAVLLLDVWWRGHTISGTIRGAIGFAPYPVVAEAEPLDCDEALYAYIGKRIVAGDAMYRDLTEFKPPLGYWLYALAVKIGGANETTIRLMPIPIILLTIALVWWAALGLSGEVAAVTAAFLYALMSTDPYVYGNGANMEHFMNLFASAAMALAVRGWGSKARWPLFVAGASVAAASLVKQVAALELVVLTGAVAMRTTSRRPIDFAALIGGFLAPCALAVSILIMQGAARAAYSDVITYGRALAAWTPADPLQKPFFLRWFVGNTDPLGVLPWPFDRTEGRAWWGAGLWPLWAVSVPTIAWALMRRSGPSRVVAAMTLAAWGAVVLPGLFWQHYYLLPLPGMAILIGVALGESLRSGKGRRPMRVVALGLVTAILATVVIQVREYLLVTPGAITTRYKGGRQWVVLRGLGRDLARRARKIRPARLFVLGIHSPLYFYSGLDGITPALFTDPLMLADAKGETAGRPEVAALLRPRKERSLRDLEAARPELIFLGAPPFAGLIGFVRANYVEVPDLLLGLHVRRDRVEAFRSP